MTRIDSILRCEYLATCGLHILRTKENPIPYSGDKRPEMGSRNTKKSRTRMRVELRVFWLVGGASWKTLPSNKKTSYGSLGPEKRMICRQQKTADFPLLCASPKGISSNPASSISYPPFGQGRMIDLAGLASPISHGKQLATPQVANHGAVPPFQASCGITNLGCIPAQVVTTFIQWDFFEHSGNKKVAMVAKSSKKIEVFSLAGKINYPLVMADIAMENGP